MNFSSPPCISEESLHESPAKIRFVFWFYMNNVGLYRLPIFLVGWHIVQPDSRKFALCVMMLVQKVSILDSKHPFRIESGNQNELTDL